jgi:type I restriction enzyme R subunit
MATAATADRVHQECVFQAHFLSKLQALGYTQRLNANYDVQHALDVDSLIAFLQETQPQEWAKFESLHPARAKDALVELVTRMRKMEGTLELLQDKEHKLPGGVRFRFVFHRPASSRVTPLQQKLFEANRFSVIEELRYSSKNGNEIDLVLFINGIPVATIELKSNLTGQDVSNAMEQYRKDRRPTGEPLLMFKSGALVHFAIDLQQVQMTTKLDNGKTFFLPFNRGKTNGASSISRGAGNDEIEGEYRIAYLYQDGEWGKAIFSKEMLLSIIKDFMHIERDKKGKGERLIFPRFHQIDAVKHLLSLAQNDGAGHSYLIQHSAGSGKSNTIGWLAHQAINLHDDAGQPIFHSVIIVTDRVNLDRQLQDTLTQTEKVNGIVAKIEGTSKQLVEAIENGKRIIVTTLQKFGTQTVGTLKAQAGKRFAVIIDEAHSSQSGKNASSMNEALTRDDVDDVVDAISARQESRGQSDSISYFAFTATPKHITLQRFGRFTENGFEAHHVYSMRQAIEEGFIIDVLKNYMTYESYYEIEKLIEADPKLSTKQAKRVIYKKVELHETAISQKVAIIVDHFNTHVRPMLGGDAKAMVVTSSREQAFNYHRQLNAYLEDRGIDLKALVAFSDKVNDRTESQINGISEEALPGEFDKIGEDAYRVLIVADKYQTGFDQPKLCAMYVDKKLAGVQAVQTLSRLNRTYPGKENVYVLDFRNDPNDIKDAFRPYFETAIMEEGINAWDIHHLENRIMNTGFVDPAAVEVIASVYATHTGKTGYDQAKINSAANVCIERYEAGDPDEQVEFRQLVASYRRFYIFVAQVKELNDTDLEKLYLYLSAVQDLLKSPTRPSRLSVSDDMLALVAAKIEKKTEGSISLKPGDMSIIKGITGFGANALTGEEEEHLSTIVKRFNDAHGTKFTEKDILQDDPILQKTIDELSDVLRANPEDVSINAFRKTYRMNKIRQRKATASLDELLKADKDAERDLEIFQHKRAVRIAQEQNRPL